MMRLHLPATALTLLFGLLSAACATDATDQTQLVATASTVAPTTTASSADETNEKSTMSVPTPMAKTSPAEENGGKDEEVSDDEGMESQSEVDSKEADTKPAFQTTVPAGIVVDGHYIDPRGSTYETFQAGFDRNHPFQSLKSFCLPTPPPEDDPVDVAATSWA